MDPQKIYLLHNRLSTLAMRTVPFKAIATLSKFRYFRRKCNSRESASIVYALHHAPDGQEGRKIERIGATRTVRKVARFGCLLAKQ